MQILKAINSKLPLYRVVKLRRRRYLTRNNRLRLRYMVSSVAVVSLTSAVFLESTNVSMAFTPSPASHIAKARIKQEKPIITLASAHSQKHVQAEILPSAGLQITQDDLEAAELLPLPDDHVEKSEGAHVGVKAEKHMDSSVPREEILEIGSGETLAGVLQNVGVSDADAYNAVRALAKHYDPRSVKAGQAIEVRLEPGEDGLEFAEMNLRIDPIKEVVVEKTSATQFQSEIKEKEVYLKPKAVKASIETSLYGSAARAGIPASIVAEMIRIYSYQVDFQRDIQEGDKVEIFYETYETEDGEFARYGDILYANLIVGGKNKPVYRFAPKDGVADYFTPGGMNTKKALMRTPIDGARMSSGFGMRRHPVLGYNKMHKGVDFAAPRGTPVYAAGDGVVEIAARNGSYGNYIRIKHNGSLKTAYAHMHKFAKNVAKGKPVKQGQIIGYVGTTGRSTGPHLHFEVLKGKGQVNPNSIDMPVGQVLAGKELDKFQHHIDTIKQQYAEIGGGMKFAHNTVTQ